VGNLLPAFLGLEVRGLATESNWSVRPCLYLWR